MGETTEPVEESERNLDVGGDPLQPNHQVRRPQPQGPDQAVREEEKEEEGSDGREQHHRGRKPPAQEKPPQK